MAKTETAPKPEAEAERDDELILDVGDLAPKRRKIRTDGGRVVEVISPKELGLQQRAEVDRLNANYDRLQKKTKLTAGQITDMEQTIDKLTRAVLADVDDAEFAEFELLDKETVITVFTAAFGSMLTKLVEGTAKSLGLGKTETDEEDEEDEETPES